MRTCDVYCRFQIRAISKRGSVIENPVSRKRVVPMEPLRWFGDAGFELITVKHGPPSGEYNWEWWFKRPLP